MIYGLVPSSLPLLDYTAVRRGLTFDDDELTVDSRLLLKLLFEHKDADESYLSTTAISRIMCSKTPAHHSWWTFSQSLDELDSNGMAVA